MILPVDLFNIFASPILAFIFFIAYTYATKEDGVDYYQAAHINLLQTEKLDRDGEIPTTGTIQWDKGSDIASAATLQPGNDGNYFDVTGTTGITAINASQSQSGTIICLHFDGILTLTHHATNLVLPGGANITTAAGDEAIFIEYDTNKWRCICYTKASGEPISGIGKIGQVVIDTYEIESTLNTGFPEDDTIPQRTEGDEILSCAITPENASSVILIFFSTFLRATDINLAALFRSDSLDALMFTCETNNTAMPMTGIYSESAGSTAARTYSVRVGGGTGVNVLVNDFYTSGASKFGLTEKCRLVVMEILP